MIRWKEEYRTGVDLIDEQHKKLFEIANDVYELLKNDIYLDKYDKVIEILEELKDYTVFHFQSEEAYMIQEGYKKIFSHKMEHDNFIAKIKSIDLGDLDEKQDEYIMEILDFVVKWIDSHILERDKLIVQG